MVYTSVGWKNGEMDAADMCSEWRAQHSAAQHSIAQHSIHLDHEASYANMRVTQQFYVA